MLAATSVRQTRASSTFRRNLLATSGVVALTPPQVSDTGDALVLNAIPTTAPASDPTASLVEEIRSSVLPPPADVGLRSHVGGYTASYVDLATKISEKLPLVVATVLTLSFLLLLLAFRSLLIPLQAAITNLLSVAASFGVLTAVFQWGWGLLSWAWTHPRVPTQSPATSP